MRAKELERILKALGAEFVRQKGSHRVWRVGTCQTVVPAHAGEDIKPGTLKAIEAQLAPCLGKGWLR